MRSRINPDEIAKLNTLLSTQNQAILKLHLFNDQDQNDSLTNRTHMMRDNYKYLQKISKAEEMIREVKQIGEEKVRLVKNGGIRRHVVSKEREDEVKNPEIEGVGSGKMRSTVKGELQHLVRKKEKPQHSSFVDRKVEAQISRIEENSHNVNQNSTQVLPLEIIEGDISKSIASVDPKIVKDYFSNKIKSINATTTPQQIYRIMNPFYELCGVPISLPLIKKYKNCAYFGNPASTLTYEGFLILHQQDKLYYGEMQNQKKNGRGTEIDFKTDSVYIGTFSKGRKVGVFTVIKPKEKYVGELDKGEYHGFGQLTTGISTYKGHFQKGLRHGQGQQSFTQMGLTISGTFVNNKFTNSPEKNEQSRLNTINSKSQAPSHVTHASNNSHHPVRNFLSDTNVVFERSAISHQNYQEFDCQFKDQDDDSIEAKHAKLPPFRIKQVREHPKPMTQRLSSNTKH